MPKDKRKGSEVFENEEKSTTSKKHEPDGVVQSSNGINIFSEALAGKMLGDIFHFHAIPFLTEQELFDVGLTSSRDSFFRSNKKGRQLIELISKYSINKPLDKTNPFINDALNQKIYLTINGRAKRIKNPILLLIYIILIKNPTLLTQPITTVDFSNRSFSGSPAKFICLTSNFMLKELVSQLIPGGSQAIADEMAILYEMETNYDLMLITLPFTTSIEEINYNSFIVWPENSALPPGTLEQVIILQKVGEELKTYRMHNAELILDKTISLAALMNVHPQQEDKASLDSDEPVIRQNIIEHLQPSTPYLIASFNNFSVFEQLRIFCGYLPALPHHPAIIKQNDSNNNTILTQWGLINGRMQATPMFYHLIEMESSRFNTSKMPPIQDGVVLVHNNTEPSYAQNNTLHQYQVFYVKEGLWQMQNNMFLTGIAQLNPANLRSHAYQILCELYAAVNLAYPLQYFINLPYPNDSTSYTVLHSAGITPIQYEYLRRGNVPYFDLKEYLRGFTAFYQKYPSIDPISADSIHQVELDWHIMVGKKQLFMPAWLAQIWCSDTPFYPLPDFNKLILQTKITTLNLREQESIHDFFYYTGITAPFTKGTYPFPHRGDAIADMEEFTDNIETTRVEPIAMELDYEGAPAIDNLENVATDEMNDEEEEEEEDEVNYLNVDNILDLNAMLLVQQLIDNSYDYTKALYLQAKNNAPFRP